MLFKITNSCSMGCSHCVSDCIPCDQHMSFDTLNKSLIFLKNIGLDRRWENLIVTGGEPCEHPNFKEMIFEIIEHLSNYNEFKSIVIATNGLWILEHENEAIEIVNHSREKGIKLTFQVSADRRFYPKRVPEHKSIWRKDGFYYVDDCVLQLYPMGRGKDLCDSGVRVGNRISPHCFNLRAINHQINPNGISDIISYLDSMRKHCTPSINWDGSVSIGESSLCLSCFTIDDDDKTALDKLNQFNCRKCEWIMKDLPSRYKDLF